MDTVNLTANDMFLGTGTGNEEHQAAGTRHSLLCSQTDACPLAWLCPNTGTDQCDSGEGCTAC
jgi:hypothetical protein